jgi:hypothetical protein
MRRPAGRTRRRILDSAYELFYRKGFGRVSVDEIAPPNDSSKKVELRTGWRGGTHAHRAMLQH